MTVSIKILSILFLAHNFVKNIIYHISNNDILDKNIIRKKKNACK